jgi:hypothetical protein
MRTETATTIRDRASRRVRRITAFAIAGATALTAAFTGIAAGSTHTRKSTVTHPAATSAPTTQKTVTAPVPSLSSNGSNAAPQPQQQQPQSVTPTVQPPVVVSGGS